MKNYLLITSLLCVSLFVKAQTAVMTMEGTSLRIVTAGTPTVVLHNTDWINNANSSVLDASSGAVVKDTGSVSSVIGGSASTSFFHLWSAKTGSSEVRLTGNIQVNRLARLISNNFNLLNSRITLGTNGMISGEVINVSGGIRFYCNDGMSGTIRKDTAINANIGSRNIGNMGLSISIGNIQSGLGTTQIIRGHDRQTSSVAPGWTGIGRYFDVIPSTPLSNLGVTLTMSYHQDELYSIAESGPNNIGLVFYRSPSYNANDWDWEEYGYGSYGGEGYGIFATTNDASNFVQLGNGIKAFSRWTISNPITNPLPVSLTKFTVDCENGSTFVRWTTESESNSSLFIIEKSQDLITWVEAGRHIAAGYSNQTINYEMNFPSETASTTYFRLRQIDNNGEIQIFDSKGVQCDPNAIPVNESVNLYPNPTIDNFTIDLVSADTYNESTVQVFDMSGRQLMSQTVQIQQGANKFTLSANKLAAGVYQVRVQSNTGKVFPVKQLIVSTR